jgi:hypothetical protein
MGKLENLKPWPKGVSGNPGGRPKKKPLTEAYQAAINDPLPGHLRRVRIAEMRSSWQKALRSQT